MPRYSEERKAAVLKKLLPPQSRSYGAGGRKEKHTRCDPE
jgi:hypothetical protein